MKIPRKIFSELAEVLLTTMAYKVTKFYSEKDIARASRRLYQGRISNRGNLEILFTIGRPNFEEREFIKKCKKVKEPFPIKKIQIKYPPKRK